MTTHGLQAAGRDHDQGRRYAAWLPRGPSASEIVANGVTGEPRDSEIVDQPNARVQWMGHGPLLGL